MQLLGLNIQLWQQGLERGLLEQRIPFGPAI
jgi:hypothetical protein